MELSPVIRPILKLEKYQQKTLSKLEAANKDYEVVFEKIIGSGEQLLAR